MLKQTLIKALPLLLGLALLGPLFLSKGTANASNPATINFQGKIVNASDGTNIASPNGTYSIVFRIYNTSSPTMTTSCTTTASCLWQETQSSVTLSNGIFQVELGSSCALTSSSCNNSTGGPINFANSNSLYLTMQFNGDTSGSNGGFMSPLIHITSVPFAFQADNSSTLGGLSSGNFVQLAQGLQTDSSSSNASIAINKTGGTANILTLQKAGTNVLLLDNNGLLTLQPAASLTSGQTAFTQTFTNASSTGGTVNGFNQTITVNNTGSASTTKGINISLTDNTALGNTNTGINVSLSGTNASQIQIGISSSVNHGSAIVGTSSGTSSSNGCSGQTLSAGVCGKSTSSSNAVGVYGTTNGNSGSFGAGNISGSGVTGANFGTGAASSNYFGVRGQANQQASAASYNSIGVYGVAASGGTGASAYGGYFALDSGGSSTSGAALYATNSSVSANILQLQNNNVNALVVNNSGQVVLGQSNTGGANGTIVFDNSSGTGTATITLAGNPTTSYTYQLPTGTVSSNQCLQSGTVSGSTVPLTFGSCGGGTALSVNGTAVGSTGNLQNNTSSSTVAATTFTNTSGNITLNVASAASGIAGTVSTTTQTFDGNKTFTGSVNVQAAGGITIGTSSTAGNLSLFNGTNTVSIQGAGSTTNYAITLPSGVAGTANECLTSTGNNAILQWLPCGAGSSRTITLVPEYPGAVMTGSGGSNTGTMTSDFCSGSGTGGLNINASICGTGSASHNYYSWTANATNNYDVWVRWQAPSDFSSFGSSAFTLNGWTTSASDSAALTVYDSSNTSCGTATISTASTAFTTAAITPSGCSVSAGSVLTLKVHLNVGVNAEYARAGEIVITYNRS